MNDTAVWLTTVIFTVTYAALAVGKVPGLRMDRAGIALVGATLMLVTGMLSLDDAVSIQAMDYKALLLLFGMMVSNVPAVLLMEPILHAIPEASRENGWLALAMSSTLAGNLTVLGSVANLIVVENAARDAVAISFGSTARSAFR